MIRRTDYFVSLRSIYLPLFPQQPSTTTTSPAIVASQPSLECSEANKYSYTSTGGEMSASGNGAPPLSPVSFAKQHQRPRDSYVGCSRITDYELLGKLGEGTFG